MTDSISQNHVRVHEEIGYGTPSDVYMPLIVLNILILCCGCGEYNYA
jgi:hypothetical protein